MPSSPSDNAKANTQPPGVSRKRRRRAPAAGATEDCFTCRKRQTKCDRRRPYCTQCIELGKECSGYRTTLTWGVGVASRGKLRGLSLPVPSSPAVSKGAERDGTPPASRSKTSPLLSADQVEAHYGSIESPPFAASPAQTASDFAASLTSPIPIPAALPATSSWPPQAMGDYHHHQESSRAPLHPHHLQRLHTALSPSYEDAGLSPSTGSLSAFSESDYPSPRDYPNTPDDFTLVEPLVPSYADPYSMLPAGIGSAENMPFGDPPRSYPIVTDDMSSSISSDQSIQESAETGSAHYLAPSSVGSASYPNLLFGDMSAGFNCIQNTYAASPEMGHIPPSSSPQQPAGPALMGSSHGSHHSSNSTARNTYELSFSHLDPRMQELLRYYDSYICPNLVAFDGPTNPYRMYVMPLAMRSESLQNAIAALSANNIRMRRTIDPQHFAYEHGHFSEDDSTPFPERMQSHTIAEEIRHCTHGSRPTGEELRYKGRSIELLNAQLADPNQAKDDSVLATLLILCLFHVCDSGFAKFKTHLAGVQKLLNLRDRSVQSNFIGWVELFFTWFDVMMSTVNDRETQIRGDCLDMLEFSANLGALEHLAGCEGRLFKIIARLGRLNLLSQNRPVRDQSHDQAIPREHPLKHSRDYYSLNFTYLDGNGWGSPVGSPLNSPAPRQTPHSPQTPTSSVPGLAEDVRHEFWTEWRDIRTRLQEWRLELPPTPALTPEQRDLLHISESFRHAAQLYTERLAHPTLPSSAPNIQQFVRQALMHIAQIGPGSAVNKFLLWPLFIIGSEAVFEEQRGLVRYRCLQIQRESGFFNNLCGLEVLERVWRGDDEGRERACRMGQVLKWRGAMDRVDGEYIVL